MALKELRNGATHLSLSNDSEKKDTHKVCRTLVNGKEELIPYFDTWQYDYSGEGTLKYKKVKRPLDKFRIEPWAAWSINEECIVEDNIENEI